MEGQDEGGTIACNVRKGDNIKEGMKLRNLQKLSKVWQISPNRQNIIFFFFKINRDDQTVLTTQPTVQMAIHHILNLRRKVKGTTHSIDQNKI